MSRDPETRTPDAPLPGRRPLRRGPLIVGILVALACFAGFWELAEEFAGSPAVLGFDAVVSAAVVEWRAPVTTLLARGVTTTGGTLVITILTTALVIALWRRRHAFAVSAVIAIGGGALMVNLMKGGFGRARPSAETALVALPHSLSFPSGHSMGSLCLAGVLTYLTLRSGMLRATKVAIVSGLVVWVVAVGMSRVYLGVHWPSDVVASWLLGVGWLALLIGYSEARREMPQR